MNGFFPLFRPAPPQPEIQDPEQIKAAYGYWRWRIFYSMFLGYAFYYLTRSSLTFAMPALIDDLGYDRGQLGLLATIWALAYGLSKFVSGIAADRSNARYFMSVGLILTGIFNILFGLSSSIAAFALFWGLNGWFQGFGWPPCARLLTHWYSRSERGSWWSSWNMSHNIGGAAIPLLTTFCVAHWGWRVALFTPGVICIVMGLVLMERLRDTPRSLGLPPIEVFRNDHSDLVTTEADEKLTSRQILFRYVLKKKAMWALAAAYFFVYMIRMGFGMWTALFFIDAKGYSHLGAGGSVSVFEAGGLVGTLVAGWTSDYFFGARRGPVNAIFSIGICCSVIALWLIPEDHVFLDNLAMFAVGVTIFGPQMLIGVVAAEISHKKAAATATGFIGWCAYVGSASAGYPLGKISENWGWDIFFQVMIVCSVCSLLLLVPLWNVDKRNGTVSSAALANG